MLKVTPLKIVAVYVVLSVIWITSSDLVVGSFATNTRAFTLLSITKGWLFIAVTASLLFGLIRRYAAERDATEKLLRESERKCRFVVDHANDGILIAQDGMLRFVNPRMAAITGFMEEELLARPFVDFLHPDDRQMVFDRHVQRMRGELDPTFAYTFRLLAKDGRAVWVETRGAVSDWNGKPATINFLSDITERKRATEELLRSEKLRSVGVLAGGIAHDFNNILTAILANISLARTQLGTGSATADRLLEAEKASLRARELTKQLLTFSRGGAPVRRTLHLAGLIRESATLALRGSGTACEFMIAADLWPIEADEGQIGQVINNLVINASQAMAGGGTVRVAAGNTVVSGTERLALADGKYVTIAVLDKGAGIPEEHRSRVFDPYFTTKQEGSGLGLAVCYSIVLNHGGVITVDSKPGDGSLFTVYLPATDRAVVMQPETGPELVAGSGRVLVMDDEEMVRSVAGEIIRALGYEVVTARDGREAVELYRRSMQEGRPFDVLIVDLTIPGGMGGRDAIRELIAIDPNVRAIVSSGYHDDPIMANYREYGFRDVIAKPYDAATLSKALARILGRL
jgi:two-component system cell cycle sensor histidine kinase/response regulator CckA